MTVSGVLVVGQWRNGPNGNEYWDGSKWIKPSVTMSGGGGGNYCVTSTSSNISVSNIENEVIDLKKEIYAIRDRLLILVPDPAKLEKYNALKEAYDNYKLLEAMLNE